MLFLINKDTSPRPIACIDVCLPLQRSLECIYIEKDGGENRLEEIHKQLHYY